MRKSALFWIAALAMVCFAGAADAQVRARADVACKPTGKTLQYDCVIKLVNSRSNEPLAGLNLTVGADMPSMPGAHAVRPVKAAEAKEAGTYQAQLLLEMHGDWALSLDLRGRIRDRVVKVMRFEPDKVGPAASERPPSPGQRH
jgi:hypothetical protein